MQTYDRILAHSAELFSEKGFEAVSMRDIAKACGIKAPSLYNHFKDKQSLYQATLKSVFDQHNEQLIAVLVGEQSAEEKLEEVIRLSACKMAEDTIFRQLILRELLQNDPQKLQFLAETVMAESCKQLEKILRQINPDSDLHFTITTLLGMTLFHFQIGNMRDFLPGSQSKHHQTDYLAEQIFKTTLKSLKA
ncbi:TetR/AcrR family transcriptional regulator [Thiomicrorhabdus sp. 6S3-12]|uniref:TetR/AcrR family transcriptional regulator n=1 Tax=Thiomicrorhabdus sp. 6S3-12 TaxID=2819681 RepID=UPI001AACE19A|nr:TetR/AcrR family transcriptional regulator [Thiomicrorhabdus sp. 6S3-12]MBO1924729.1 TetR/AcrR family transcriptional regulator [Thiomicrorhabdus sp. 6S3-12]